MSGNSLLSDYCLRRIRQFLGCTGTKSGSTFPGDRVVRGESNETGNTRISLARSQALEKVLFIIKPAMNPLLVTGFEPFAGRKVNASWIAASLFARQFAACPVETIQLPVVWGSPGKMLIDVIERIRPTTVVALGEGKPGCFWLESLAFNRRAVKPDNQGLLPNEGLINDAAARVLNATAPLSRIQKQLQSAGIPVLQSLNAGGFLCEETLFELECIRQRTMEPHLVMFVHLPPFGSHLLFRQQPRVCDHGLLEEFVKQLYSVVMPFHAAD